MSQKNLSNQILRDSLYLIRRDKEILSFSFLSLLTILILNFILLVNIVFLMIPEIYSPLLGLAYLAFGIIAYSLFHIISNFFFAAILVSVYKRVHGGNPTFLEGLQFSVKNMGKIVRWSILDRYFNSYIFVRNLQKEKVAHPLEIDDNFTLSDPFWRFVSALIFPIIILEKKTINEAVHQASEMAKKSWSDQLKLGFIHTGVVLIIFFCIMVVIKILFDNYQSNGQFILLITFGAGLILTFLGVIGITFRHVYHAILYNYCVTGKLPSESLHYHIDNSGK